MKKVLLKIGGMSCSACSNGLEKVLNKQEGIKKAQVNLIMNNALIEFDDKLLKLSDVENFIKKAGFESLGIDNLKYEESHEKKEKIELIILMLLFIFAMYMSMSNMLNLPKIPLACISENKIVYLAILFVFASFAIILERKIIINGIRMIRYMSPNMDTLITLGVISSYFFSIFGAYMVIKGNENYSDSIYFDSVLAVLFLAKLGRVIENRNKDKTKEAIKDLVRITPEYATVIGKNGEIKKITIDEVKKGDILLCQKGDKIAVDGIIVEGTTHIDESFITGESRPVKKQPDSKVIAGSINFEGVIKYKAEKIGRESTISQIVNIVTQMSSTKPKIARVADVICSYFVPFVILIAILTLIVNFAITGNMAYSFNLFVSVLVVACPCSLGLATPLAIVVASGIASKMGILIKSSEVLENAYKVKNVVLDKTGTLTKGKLSISKIINYSDLTENDIMNLLYNIEKNSNHPIAKAILMYDKMPQVYNLNIEKIEELPGYGMKCVIEKSTYFAGNKKLMEENGITINEEIESIGSLVYFAKDKDLICVIELSDIIDEASFLFISNLKKRNIKVAMLTGDNYKVAGIVGESLGIDNVISNVTPIQKKEEIEKLKKEGIVLMCGDGINDSASLVISDIGVTLSNATDIAVNSGNVMIMNGKIDKIINLIDLSSKTIKIIKQNLFWAFFYNILMLPIAMGVFKKFNILINPMIASFAMMLSSITVSLNALRINKIREK